MPGTLAHTPGEIVRRVLIDLGQGSFPVVGSKVAWQVYAENEPDAPDSVITCTTTTGVQGGRIMINGEWSESNGVQIRVRGANHTGAWTKINAIKVALDAAFRKTISFGDAAYLVWNFSRRNLIAIGNEPESKRKLYSLNYLITVRQT